MSLCLCGDLAVPVPLVIQNSSSRVTPETASSVPAASSHRPNPRPCQPGGNGPHDGPARPDGRPASRDCRSS
jgi:hypothetical protein